MVNLDQRIKYEDWLAIEKPGLGPEVPWRRRDPEPLPGEQSGTLPEQRGAYRGAGLSGPGHHCLAS